MKCAGILMPVASLPSDFGIGDFGPNSYRFVDDIYKAGIQIWQILPLNPLGFGNSPYQPYSSYAGDELYISLEKLVEDGLLYDYELSSDLAKNYRKKASQKKAIDYKESRALKEQFLKVAYQRFQEDGDYQKFIQQDWVYNYGVFLTLKKKNHLVCWNEWPRNQQEWIKDHQYDMASLSENIRYELFVQYIFYKQWTQLKSYANCKEIKIMGDLPFYVGIDSLDVWVNQEEFLLGADHKPIFIAGVPPDYFSTTGQRWGNPIYNWEKMRDTKYQFWIKRLLYCNHMFDITRIDHFRAFDTYWKIPASCPSAVEGEWIEAPGKEFFQLLLTKYQNIDIVVEDLGDLRDEVHQLRDEFRFKGMKVLQFSFNPKEKNNGLEDRTNLILYTGTHDNHTMRGWFVSQPEAIQSLTIQTLKKQGYDTKEIAWAFVQLAFDSKAEMVIVPYQDYVNIDDRGRINTPGTLGSPNWEWKIANLENFEIRIERIRNLIAEKKIKIHTFDI